MQLGDLRDGDYLLEDGWELVVVVGLRLAGRTDKRKEIARIGLALARIQARNLPELAQS
jgi:hypothetical protein